MPKKKNMYPDRFRKLIRDAIPHYRKNLGFDNYLIDVHYMDDNKPSSLAMMEITTDADYLRATVTVYPHALEHWKREGDEKLLESVAHEVAHIATQPMRDLIERPFKSEEEVRIAWESLTTLIGRYTYEQVKNQK